MIREKMKRCELCQIAQRTVQSAVLTLSCIRLRFETVRSESRVSLFTEKILRFFSACHRNIHDSMCVKLEFPLTITRSKSSVDVEFLVCVFAWSSSLGFADVYPPQFMPFFNTSTIYDTFTYKAFDVVWYHFKSELDIRAWPWSHEEENKFFVRKGGWFYWHI